MSPLSTNEKPVATFPRLDRVARSQRRLMRRNALVTFFFLVGAVASLTSLAACASETTPTLGEDGQGLARIALQRAVDALNANDSDAIDVFVAADARAELARIRAEVGPDRIQFELHDVRAVVTGLRATLAVIPEGAAEPVFTVDLAATDAGVRLFRAPKSSPDRAPEE